MTEPHPYRHYATVAAIYRDEMNSVHRGQPRPLRVIADSYGVPHTTAAAWVKRAKGLGLLNADSQYVCRGCRLHCVEN